MNRVSNNSKITNTKSGYSIQYDIDNAIIGKWIQKARKTKGLSLNETVAKLADVGLNVNVSSVSRWENGSIIPNCYQLVALAKVLDIVEEIQAFSSDFDIASSNIIKLDQFNNVGKTELRRYKDYLLTNEQFLKKEIKQKKTLKIEYVRKPISSLKVSAGTGAFLDEDDFEWVEFPKNAVPKGADFGVRISGDSMEPVYHDGQTVWVKRCSELIEGEVGIFIYDGNGYIKVYNEQEPDDDVIETYIDEDGKLRKQPVLISYNKKYKPIVINPEASFQIVGSVLKA